MITIVGLEQKKAEIEKQIEQATKQQKQEDLKMVRQLCKLHGFTYNMLKNHLAEGRKGSWWATQPGKLSKGEAKS